MESIQNATIDAWVQALAEGANDEAEALWEEIEGFIQEAITNQKQYQAYLQRKVREDYACGINYLVR